MDLIYNAMIASVKTPGERPNAASKGGETDKFQKLMDQKQNAKDPAATTQQETPETTETAAPVQEDEAPVMEDLKELEKRMSQAAMLAMMQNPIVAGIAEETPQVLTDSSWEDGLVPVGYDDYDGYRIVHWMQSDVEAKDVKGVNAEAAQWIEEQNIQDTEALAPVVEEVPEAEVPAMEIKASTVETGAPREETDTEAPDEAPVESAVFEDVKAVPVKVGEAPVAEKTEEPVEKQIAPKLTEALRQGETHVELQLTPENLGKVTVEMTWKEDGGLVVQLHAENQRTQGLLEKSMSGLEALLSRENQQEVRVEVPRQQESQQQNFYDGRQGHGQHQQQEERRQERQINSGEDFLQQLRLGLIPGEED